MSSTLATTEPATAGKTVELGSPRSLRTAAALTIAVAVAVHIPVAVAHLREVPYLGIAFYLFVILEAGAAGAVLVDDRRRLWTAIALLNSAALGTYLVSRWLGLPGAQDDRHDWGNGLGAIAILAEIATVLLSIVALRRSRSLAS